MSKTSIGIFLYYSQHCFFLFIPTHQETAQQNTLSSQKAIEVLLFCSPREALTHSNRKGEVCQTRTSFIEGIAVASGLISILIVRHIRF